MSILKGKKILLGITGGIAAYKVASLVRLFVKSGAVVKVIMTRAATEFISPLTFSTLTGNPVIFEMTSEGNWNSHVELGLWADFFIIAPATANTMAKMATGHVDNILLTTYLSAKCSVFFAPAMDLDMWKHPATKKNINELVSFGNIMIPVGFGELASGLIGEGRMAEPEEIVNFLENYYETRNDFSGKKILITAGPTYEPIDPVRFIGNRSSGKMGIALAENFASRGAEVVLVLGPSNLKPKHPAIKTIFIKTAQEMFDVATKNFKKYDIAVLAAAVADYRPKNIATEKIKKKLSGMTIELEKTPDIAAFLGEIKNDKQIIVGFALETTNEISNAKEKLKRKSFDFIVLNSLKDKSAGFNYDTNKITIIHRDNKIIKFELKSKSEVADDIVSTIFDLL